jgi:hypothetical protein
MDKGYLTRIGSPTTPTQPNPKKTDPTRPFCWGAGSGKHEAALPSPRLPIWGVRGLRGVRSVVARTQSHVRSFGVYLWVDLILKPLD